MVYAIIVSILTSEIWPETDVIPSQELGDSLCHIFQLVIRRPPAKHSVHKNRNIIELGQV